MSGGQMVQLAEPAGPGRLGRAGLLLASVIVAVAAFGTAAAQAYVVREKHNDRGQNRLYGITPRPGTRAALARAAAGPSQPPLTYGGGSVMVTSRLYLIFWGSTGSFPATYQGPITQWAKDLATDSGKTTNEFSVTSDYYQTNPTKGITRNVLFGGAVTDTHPYPANGCGDNPGGVCLSDGQLQLEIQRLIAANHWPTDNPFAPEEQYLMFTPNGVDSCSDPTQTSCAFSPNNGYCGYHSSFGIGNNAVVYSNIPYQSGCDSGLAPSGVARNADTDGALDTAIHEIAESATDPGSDGNLAWADSGGYEIGDKCDGQSVFLNQQQTYGTPLGGSLTIGNAFNQLIGGHTYYTQQLWSNRATKTPVSRSAGGCLQRVGPTPVFQAPTTIQHVNHVVSFNGSGSYDVASTITLYGWNYGDGSAIDTTHGANGSHTYTTAGTYNVRLTVEDSSGALDSSTETQTVKVVSP